MSVHKESDNSRSFSDFNYEEDPETLSHKKHVRRMLEDRLERKRLKAELDDEIEGEFNWDDVDR